MSSIFRTLEERGFIAQVSGESLSELLSKSKFTVYAGFDPTADSLPPSPPGPPLGMIVWHCRTTNKVVVRVTVPYKQVAHVSPDPGQKASTNAVFIKTYEDGKDRRYKLLFAANGGAFAIAKLIGVHEEKVRPQLGSLDLWHLAVGMAVFTTVMVADIHAFGLKCHRRLPELYRLPGMLVLSAFGLLFVAGWSLAGIPQRISDLQTGGLVVFAVSLYLGALVIIHNLLGGQFSDPWGPPREPSSDTPGTDR